MWRVLLAAAAAAAAVAGIGWVALAPDMDVDIAPQPRTEAMVARGRMLIEAAACASCHTPRDRPDLYLAGGPRMHTPFGDFNVPNITPDHATGIGGWSDEDFVRAMRNGVSPEGEHLYPIFPYRWYGELQDADLLAMKAYLDTIPAVRREIPPHDLWFPVSIRRAIGAWKLFNMREPTPPASEDVGAMLTDAIGHCGACHTPSLYFAYYERSNLFAGDETALGAYAASNITPHATGIGEWSEEDIVRVLAIGVRPDGTPVRGAMAEFVADSSSRLTDAQRRAIAAYLRTIPPVERRIARTHPPTSGDVLREHSLVLSVTQRPNLEAGRAVAFSQSPDACVNCHAAAPSLEMALPVDDMPLFPLLRGQSAMYMRARLREYAAGDHPIMSPIARRLSDAEMRDVSDFYAAQTPPYNVEQRPRTPVRGSAALRRGYELAWVGDPARGVTACMTCHGENGEGFAPSFPYLAGQPAAYTEAQFAFWRARTRDDGPLGVMGEIARRLPEDDVRAIAEYYETLARPVSPSERGPGR
jgi:cytochrome c553